MYLCVHHIWTLSIIVLCYSASRVCISTVDVCLYHVYYMCVNCKESVSVFQPKHACY